VGATGFEPVTLCL